MKDDFVVSVTFKKYKLQHDFFIYTAVLDMIVSGPTARKTFIMYILRNLAEHMVACVVRTGSAHMEFIAAHATVRRKLQSMYPVSPTVYIHYKSKTTTLLSHNLCTVSEP